MTWLSLSAAAEQFGIPEARLRDLALRGVIAGRMSELDIEVNEFSVWEWIEGRKWELEGRGCSPAVFGAKNSVRMPANQIPRLVMPTPILSADRRKHNESGEPSRETLDRLMAALEQ